MPPEFFSIYNYMAPKLITYTSLFTILWSYLKYGTHVVSGGLKRIIVLYWRKLTIILATDHYKYTGKKIFW